MRTAAAIAKTAVCELASLNPHRLKKPNNAFMRNRRGILLPFTLLAHGSCGRGALDGSFILRGTYIRYPAVFVPSRKVHIGASSSREYELLLHACRRGFRTQKIFLER